MLIYLIYGIRSHVILFMRHKTHKGMGTGYEICKSPSNMPDLCEKIEPSQIYSSGTQQSAMGLQSSIVDDSPDILPKPQQIFNHKVKILPHMINVSSKFELHTLIIHLCQKLHKTDHRYNHFKSTEND